MGKETKRHIMTKSSQDTLKNKHSKTETAVFDDNFTTRKLMFNFDALADLGAEITSDKDFIGVMKASLYLIMGTVSVSKGAILEYNNLNGAVTVLASKGIEDLTGFHFFLDKKTADSFRKENRIISYKPDSSFFKNKHEEWGRFVPSILVPIVVKNELICIITLSEKLFFDGYSKEDLNTISIMAKQIGIFIYNHHLLNKLSYKVEENRRLFENLKLIYYDTIQAFAAAIDAKDAYTKGHSRRVAKYCVALGEELGMPKKELEGIKIAGFLHDIGKIAIDKEIINKPSGLTEKELYELNQHPLVSYEILSRVRFPWKNIPLSVRYHHERVDGYGYPDKLKGNEIPMPAKIMAVVDAFDAMTSDRPYRKRLSFEHVLLEFKNEIGKQFDVNVAKGMLGLLRKEIKKKNEHRTILSGIDPDFDARTIGRLIDRIDSEFPYAEGAYKDNGTSRNNYLFKGSF